jgi:tRNA (guanine37-N1)-methyltransferase
MIYFDIITIFPKIFDSFLKESLIKKAQEKGLIKIRIYNLRDFTKDKHKTVDDKPYGGGLGMVLKLEPIYRALQAIKRKNPKTKKLKVILFTPRGKQFTQRLAYKLSKLDRIIMVCGRYEGIDERVVKYLADLKLSIGPYDLMGGEVPAMVVIETVSRLIPGVIGKKEFLKERLKKGGFIEYPQYTRPEVFSPKKGVYWKVPKVLLSGHHQKIEEWRKKHQKIIEK